MSRGSCKARAGAKTKKNKKTSAACTRSRLTRSQSDCEFNRKTKVKRQASTQSGSRPDADHHHQNIPCFIDESSAWNQPSGRCDAEAAGASERAALYLRPATSCGCHAKSGETSAELWST